MMHFFFVGKVSCGCCCFSYWWALSNVTRRTINFIICWIFKHALRLDRYIPCTSSEWNKEMMGFISLFFSLSHVWHRKMHFDVHKKRAFLTVSHVDISSIRLENANFGHKHTIPVFFHFIQPLVVGKKRAPALQFKLWLFFLMILMVNSKTCLMALKPYFFPSIFHTSAILSARL